MTDEDLIVDLNRLFWLLEEDRQYLARANTARLAARRIQAQAAEIERLRGELAKEIEEKLDAISTLDAWFDRRKLAHDSLDQAVVDAASGYLRTSRCGGMKQKDSDLVLAVIQNMARLSVFADLFARSTLADLTGAQKDGH